MSLYDDDEDEKIQQEEPPTKKPARDLIFLQSQLKAKKAQLQNAPSSKFSSPMAAPVMDLSGKAKRPSLLKPVKAQPLSLNGILGFSVVPQALKEDKVLLFGEVIIKDEYNPTAPTEYFAHKQKRDVRIAKEKVAKEVAERLSKEMAEEESKRKSGACFAPPPSLIEFDTKIEIKKEPPKSLGPEKPAFIPPSLAGGKGRGLGIAASIMSKMGYREGSGLGRTEQGMSTALRVERTGKNAGVIVSEFEEIKKEVRDRFEKRDDNAPKSNMTEVLKQATKILLLRNMIALEEVDDELDLEIREEMKKYGQINEVRIQKMEDQPEDESVRIFVEFTNVAQAIKAFVDLNGRFFAGKPIKTGFYSVDDFRDENFTAPLNQ